MSKKDPKHEDGVRRTVDAFLSTGNRESKGHTFRVAEEYDSSDVAKIKAVILKQDPGAQVNIDIDKSNVHVVSNSSPQVIGKSLRVAGYEVLEIF